MVRWSLVFEEWGIGKQEGSKRTPVTLPLKVGRRTSQTRKLLLIVMKVLELVVESIKFSKHSHGEPLLPPPQDTVAVIMQMGSSKVHVLAQVLSGSTCKQREKHVRRACSQETEYWLHSLLDGELWSKRNVISSGMLQGSVPLRYLCHLTLKGNIENLGEIKTAEFTNWGKLENIS